MAHGYGQYCPIAKAVEIVGDRWSLLILRDMLCGASRFNDLARGLPGLSRSLLSKRLRQFESAGLVERLDGRYLLTPAGEELRGVVFGMGEWGVRWAFPDPRPDELDAELLVWWIHTRLDLALLPDRRVVLRFEFTDDRRLFWIVIEDLGPSVCTSDPGFDVDVVVRSDVATLTVVWLGRIPLRSALRDGSVQLIGPAALTRRLPDVFQLSPIAETVRRVTA